MNSRKLKKSRHAYKELADRSELTVHSMKKRTPIIFHSGLNIDGTSKFEREKVNLVEKITIFPDPKIELPVLTYQELLPTINYYRVKCWIKNKCSGTVAKTKRKKIAKIPTRAEYSYMEIVKYFLETQSSWSTIRKKFKIGNKTFQQILNTYYENGNDLDKLKDTMTNRGRYHSDSLNDHLYISFIQTMFNNKRPDMVISSKDIMEKLKVSFSELADIKQRKVYELMRLSGLRFKRAKIKIVNHKQE